MYKHVTGPLITCKTVMRCFEILNKMFVKQNKKKRGIFKHSIDVIKGLTKYLLWREQLTHKLTSSIIYNAENFLSIS